MRTKTRATRVHYSTRHLIGVEFPEGSSTFSRRSIRQSCYARVQGVLRPSTTERLNVHSRRYNQYHNDRDPLQMHCIEDAMGKSVVDASEGGES